MKSVSFTIVMLVSTKLFLLTNFFDEQNGEVLNKSLNDYPTINISTSYYIEGSGVHESKLSKDVKGWGECQDGTFMLGYDCAAIEKIHSKVNQILSQADIRLTRSSDCEITPCVIWTNVPSEMALTHRVGNIDVGVNPKHYRDGLGRFDKMAEGFFVTHANLLAQAQQNNWDMPGYQAELFVHFVKSLQLDGHSNTIGVYVPEGYRRNYTNQRIRIQGDTYPSNTTRYIILVGYDDLNKIDHIAETVAHEIGHALGLKHYNVSGNLMTSKGLGNTNLTSSQTTSMRDNWTSFRRYGAGVSSYKSFCEKKKQ